MSKVPDVLKVKFIISNITLEVPKPFFEENALKAAIFSGRKGRAAQTRRTKWFTLVDPSKVPSSTRQVLVMPPADGERQRSTTRTDAVPDTEENPNVQHATGELAVMEFNGLNNVVYEVDMKPLNIFDGNWVFDRKAAHPLTVFAKVLTKARPGVKISGAKSEMESNQNEMIQMDEDELEEDNFSGSEQGGEEDNIDGINLKDIGLDADQLAALAGDENPEEYLKRHLMFGIDCKKRYLEFPKSIDLGSIINTSGKKMEFSERVKCKNAALVGAVLSFTVTAELPKAVIEKFEEKNRSKEEKEERKRREKEEKVLEKERKKAAKEEEKRLEKERKKSGKGKNYGEDVTNNEKGAGVRAAEAAKPPEPGVEDVQGKKKPGLKGTVKTIFTPKVAAKPGMETPFPIKREFSSYPYLILLDNFKLTKLVLDPVNYVAVHIRLGCDAVSTTEFPRLLLDASDDAKVRETTVTWYDGSERAVKQFHFSGEHIYFGDKHIRNVTGFETLRALHEHDKRYREMLKLREQGVDAMSPRPANTQSTDLFQAEMLNVGERFESVEFEPTKYSSNENQSKATKFTRVTAQLIVKEERVGEKAKSDLEEKKEYIKQLQKEQRDREKEEKEKEKAERKAAKDAAKAAKKAAKKGEAGGDAASENLSASASKSMRDKDTATDKQSESVQKESDENFESGGADHIEEEGAQKTEELEASTKKEKKSKDGLKLIKNETSSFQLGTHMVNEDFLPEEGKTFHIMFETGEELYFRARRVFLPSCCQFGEDGSKKEKTIVSFDPEEGVEE